MELKNKEALFGNLRRSTGSTTGGLVGLLCDRTVITFSVLFAFAIAGLSWHQARQSSQLVELSAIQHAARYSEAVAEFRSLYTSEVVSTAKSHGLEITHDYKNRPGAIPLPATLSMLLGNRLAKNEGGGQTQLYSPYPFPWRSKTGGLKDDFSREAWASVTQNPNKPFYRFQDENGHSTVRYAVADRMRASCVHCHNTHPDTPKNDWREGDVRGILEVSFPMKYATTKTEAALQESWWVIVGIGILGFSCISLVVRKQREESRQLEQRVIGRTQELQSATEKQIKTVRLLEEREARLQAILETANEGIVTINAQGVVESFNEAAAKMFGFRTEEVVGKNVSMLIPPPSGEKPNQHPTNYLRTDHAKAAGINREVEGKRKDGTLFPMELAVSEVHLDNAYLLTAIIRDVTQRHQLQTELAHAQKLEAVGQLAAGIAHEINTPTQYVGDNTRFLKDAFGDIDTVFDSFEKLLQAAKERSVDEQLVAEVEATLQRADIEYLREEIPQAIGQSLDGVERVAKIVRAMKEFSHPGTEEKSLVNLTEAIETTITVARNEWKYVAEMITEFDLELPVVPGLPGELNQVFLNLIVNAAHAVGDTLGDDATEKGTITVGTRRDGDWVEIFIRDTGTGIPQDVRTRIFDPFFTTKEVGRGTGQGLAIARSVVVDKHGGTIDCETETGKGTTFLVRLPIHSSRQLSEVDDASSNS
ncbi:MAG: PAS domain S-box protein [Planctomycetes bacterium]|nr:PAS domain S-box protein [Planctomycetota bacterium]